MQLSREAILRVAEHRWRTQDMVHDFATEYGEGGYYLDTDKPTPMILSGDWNERGPRKHPRLADQLEQQGVDLVWYDEWVIDSHTSKAYRTQPGSHGWEIAIAYWDGEIMTPDDSFETWLDYALQEGKGLNRTQVSGLLDKLTEAGFEMFDDDGHQFESGFHPGMDADPDKIRAELIRRHGADTEVVFTLTESSQFYYGFTAWWRLPESEDE